MDKKYRVSVIHSFPVQQGVVLDGDAVLGKKFVTPGNHDLSGEVDVVGLEASGYLEILDVDGDVVVFPPCCSGH